MSLSSRLAVGVSDRARRRGLDYFREGRARVNHSDGESVEYLVRGTRQYAVTLSIEDDVLYCACTCPFFVDREEACKHVWAAVLDCERGRVLAASARVVALEPDPLETEARALGDAERGPLTAAGSPGRRPDWLLLMRQLASYVTATANGDMAMLISSGFPNQKPMRERIGELPTPSTPLVRQGALTGQIGATVSPIYGASSYNWRVALASAPNTYVRTAQKVGGRSTFEGLIAGELYNVECNAVGAAGPSNWSVAGQLRVI